MNSSNNSKPVSKKKRRIGSNFFYDFVKITGAIPALIWIRPKVIHIGEKCPKGGVLISSNHPTFVDPITLLTAFPRRRLHSLVTKDLYKNKLMTFMLSCMHCIQVDKDNFNMASFHEAVELCLKAAQVEKRMRYVGWDVAITPDGPVFVEGNNLPGYDMPQNHRFHDDGCGLKAAFEAAIND